MLVIKKIDPDSMLILNYSAALHDFRWFHQRVRRFTFPLKSIRFHWLTLKSFTVEFNVSFYGVFNPPLKGVSNLILFSEWQFSVFHFNKRSSSCFETHSFKPVIWSIQYCLSILIHPSLGLVLSACVHAVTISVFHAFSHHSSPILTAFLKKSYMQQQSYV